MLPIAHRQPRPFLLAVLAWWRRSVRHRRLPNWGSRKGCITSRGPLSLGWRTISWPRKFPARLRMPKRWPKHSDNWASTRSLSSMTRMRVFADCSKRSRISCPARSVGMIDLSSISSDMRVSRRILLARNLGISFPGMRRWEMCPNRLRLNS